MCTNYVAPGEDAGLNELKIDNFIDLYRDLPWKREIYPDYDAPIVASIDSRFTPLIAGFGFWPRALQKAKQDADKEAGRRVRKILSTMNVRDDNLGKSRLYGPAWRGGQRCLIPAAWIHEPNWETGKHVKYRIGLDNWRQLCVAGISRTLKGPDGSLQRAMAMITVNGDGHPIFSRMHRPGDEKRAVVILRPDDWEEWLTTQNIEAARAMLQLYPADDMVAEPVADGVGE